ncbi:MAG: S53 family peptidase, partial [Solirubrobacteraceae bacterium]
MPTGKLGPLRRGALAALGAAGVLGGFGAPAASAQQVMVALRPRDPAAMAALARAVSSPASDEFRRYLNVAQFVARFGARPGALSAVARTLRAHGLRVQAPSANDLTILVDGRPADLARAFGTRLVHVRLRHGRSGLVATRHPRLDARVAPYVQAVLGLDTLGWATNDYARAPRASLRHAHRAVRALVPASTGGPQPCHAATSALRLGTWGPGWTANQVAAAYDFGPLYRAGDKGQGVTIALYEQEPNLASDVLAFQRCYGTHAQVSYVRVGRGAGTGAGSGEAIGDIDQLISFAPKARIIVYQGAANTPGAADPLLSAIVSQDRASVISSSWGDCEPEEGRAAATVDENLLEEAAIQGQTFVVAAGDDGAEDCYAPGSDHNRAITVDSPGSSPWATSVGGTLLSALSPLTETVWNNALSDSVGNSGITAGAGGGGISSFWPMPPYQSGAPAGLNVIN